MAGLAGFEPANDGTKTRCLTTWRQPNVLLFYTLFPPPSRINKDKPQFIFYNFYLERASYAYENGNKAEAPIYAQEGHMHKDRRNALNAEISELGREVKQAKANAEASAPIVDSSAFNSAKAVFESAKSRHESARDEFRRIKAERNAAKAEFDSLQARFKRAQAAFKQRLEEVKSAKASQKQRTIDTVNMALVRSNAHYLGTLFGQDAKIVPRRDGQIDVYFGGLNTAGDGMGHGHAVIDTHGNVTYLRDAWVSDKRNDYLIDDKADRYGKPTHKI